MEPITGDLNPLAVASLVAAGGTQRGEGIATAGILVAFLGAVPGLMITSRVLSDVLS